MEIQNNNTRMWVLDENRKEIAYINHPKVGDRTMNIHEISVEPAYQGKGIAGMMLESLVEIVRKEKRNVILTCPYAKIWFAKHPENKDILQK